VKRPLLRILLALICVLAVRGIESIVADGLYYWALVVEVRFNFLAAPAGRVNGGHADGG